MAIGIAAVGATAASAAVNSIAGTVSLPADADPQWLESVEVRARNVDTGVSEWMLVDDETGGYEFDGLANGRYEVYVQAPAFVWDAESETAIQPGLMSEYYDDALVATEASVVVLTGGPQTGIDVALEYGQSITGTVQLPTPYPASAAQSIELEVSDGDEFWRYVQPAADGTFAVKGLVPGTYDITPRVPSTYDDPVTGDPLPLNVAPDRSDGSARVIVTEESGAEGLTLVMVDAAGLSGTLMGAGGDYSQVSVTDADGTYVGNCDLDRDDASYFCGQLSGGDYRLRYEEWNGDDYGSQYLVDDEFGTLFSPADSEMLSGLDFEVRPMTATIAGSMTATGFTGYETNPGPGARPDYLGDVVLYEQLDGQWVKTGLPRFGAIANGIVDYAIPGLANGTYTVGFETAQTPFTDNGPLAEQWYDHQTSLAEATPVALAAGQSVTGIHGTIQPAATAPVVLADISDVKGTPGYTEFFDEITWFANQGITRGYDNGDGTADFRPLGKVTRDAMAAFLYRYAGSPDVELPEESPFVDVTPGNTAFYKEIVWLSEQGITTGWDVGGGKKEFRPLAKITRDAMAAFLYRFANEPPWTAPGESPFTDVKASKPFYREITWLADAGITTGWSVPGGQEFRPYNEITRDAMAAFVYRYFTLVD